MIKTLVPGSTDRFFHECFKFQLPRAGAGWFGPANRQLGSGPSSGPSPIESLFFVLERTESSKNGLNTIRNSPKTARNNPKTIGNDPKTVRKVIGIV